MLVSKILEKNPDAALGLAHITVNMNSVPNDPRSPFVTSGLRIGTPAFTRRGANVSDSAELATWICDVLDAIKDEGPHGILSALFLKKLCLIWPNVWE